MSNFTGCLTDQIKLSTNEKILGYGKKKVLYHFAFSRLKTKPSGMDKEKEAQIFYWRRS